MVQRETLAARLAATQGDAVKRAPFSFSHRLGCAAVLAGLAVGGGFGAESTGAVTVPAGTGIGAAVAASSQAFADPVGDNPGGSPDITTVQVSNDDAGMLEFRIVLPNRTDLTDADFVTVNLDVDQNPATGCFGIEWVIGSLGRTAPVPDGFLLSRYPSGCGTVETDTPQESLVGAFDGATSTLLLRINRSELGDVATFRLFITASVDPIGVDTVDFSGDVTPWVYQVVIAPPRDQTPPRTKALPSSGVHGKVAKLRYTVFDESGRAREEVTLHRGGRMLAKVRTRLGVRGVTKIYAASWRVPANVVGTLRFCVRAWDAAGNRSAQSCARLAIR
jgi:hypothetical protein